MINEEMYEEEDDDLPLQYRRLTAHLQTGSQDFNRKLAAYLTNHVAMRSALQQAVNDSYAQVYPGAPQFQHNNLNTAAAANTFPSPMLNQQSMQHQMPTPNSYRASPYPTPNVQHRMQGRPQSISIPQEISAFKSPQSARPSTEQPGQNEMRRMSMPAPSSKSSPVAARSNSTPQPKSATLPDGQGQAQGTSTPQSQQNQPAMQYPKVNQSAQQYTAYQSQMFDHMGPLTTSLPVESQQLLGPALDPSNPYSNMLMAGSEDWSTPNFNWGYNFPSKGGSQMQAPFSGMDSTLAPSVLDMQPASSGQRSSGLTAADYSLDNLNAPDMKGINMSRNMSAQGGSGQVTPGLDANWESFINGDGGWGAEGT